MARRSIGTSGPTARMGEWRALTSFRGSFPVAVVCPAESAPFPRRRRASRYVGCHGRSRSDHPRGSAQAAVHLVPRDPGRADRRACGGAAVGGQPGGDARQLPSRPRSAGQRRCAPQAPAAVRIHRRGPDRSFRRAKPTGRSSRRSSVRTSCTSTLRPSSAGRSSRPAAPHHESQPTCLARAPRQPRRPSLRSAGHVTRASSICSSTTLTRSFASATASWGSATIGSTEPSPHGAAARWWTADGSRTSRRRRASATRPWSLPG